mmetsp:Transcript_26009/g.66163  ORF Transcript_26009/g.66163 Transcript_26009/m.66163 type:complete len:233 (-) Transcript_26009:266-964(-)
MHAVVAEPLTHGAAGEGCKVLERSRLGSRCGDDDRVVEGAALFECLDDLGHGRTLLTDSDIHTEQLFAFALGGIIGRLLVQDGVDAHGGLAGLAITNDEFALTAANRDHGINSLDTRHHGLVNGFARDDARGLYVNTCALSNVGQRALAVDWLTQRVHDATEQAFAYRRGHDLVETFDGVAFLDRAVVAENHDADIVAFKVQRHAFDAAVEFNHFASLYAVETVDAGDTVAN